MGDARRRGSYEDRKKEAMIRLVPDNLVCNECGEVLIDIEVMDIKPFDGITMLVRAGCPKCGQFTWGVMGEPEAVYAMHSVILDTYVFGHGESGQGTCALCGDV